MDTYFKAITRYCEAHSSQLPALFQDLERETHLKTIAPQMLSGPLQGQLLRFISLLTRPRAVLEIGTFTGYGSLCLAEGLVDDGALHTIEANPELEYLIRKYIGRAGMTDRIHLHIGRAETVIPALPGSFDLVFIDAGKQDYARFFELVVGRVRPGGLILADNVLWGGKVLDPDPDADAGALRAFSQQMLADPRVECLMLPVRDGLMVMRLMC